MASLIKSAMVGVVLLALPWVIVALVNLAHPTPIASFDPQSCTRHCHNKGCRHTPRLPAALTSDEGLYGKTIRGLFATGQRTGLGRRTGYGAANLALFVLLWPGLMWSLAMVGLWQRRTLKARRKAAGEQAS